MTVKLNINTVVKNVKIKANVGLKCNFFAVCGILDNFLELTSS